MVQKLLVERSPPLKLKLPTVHHRAQVGQAARSNILTAMLQTPKSQNYCWTQWQHMECNTWWGMADSEGQSPCPRYFLTLPVLPSPCLPPESESFHISCCLFEVAPDGSTAPWRRSLHPVSPLLPSCPSPDISLTAPHPSFASVTNCEKIAKVIPNDADI